MSTNNTDSDDKRAASGYQSSPGGAQGFDHTADPLIALAEKFKPGSDYMKKIAAEVESMVDTAYGTVPENLRKDVPASFEVTHTQKADIDELALAGNVAARSFNVIADTIDHFVEEAVKSGRPFARPTVTFRREAYMLEVTVKAAVTQNADRRVRPWPDRAVVREHAVPVGRHGALMVDATVETPAEEIRPLSGVLLNATTLRDVAKFGEAEKNPHGESSPMSKATEDALNALGESIAKGKDAVTMPWPIETQTLGATGNIGCCGGPPGVLHTEQNVVDALDEVRSYLAALSPEDDAFSVPNATLPAAKYVRPDADRPAAPPILNRLAAMLRNGSQRVREDAVAALSEIFHDVWSKALPNCGVLVVDRADTNDSRAKWDRVVSPKYVADIGVVDGAMLGVFLNGPASHVRRMAEKLQDAKDRCGDLPIAKIEMYHQRPKAHFRLEDIVLSVPHLVASSWTDAAGYVQTAKPDEGTSHPVKEPVAQSVDPRWCGTGQ